MHHLTDVVVGVANGVVCAWLAWHYLRRREPRTSRLRGRAAAVAR
jgi:undecaprenyl-diphosphatase